MNIAEVFANPVTLAEEIQKFKDHNWTSAEWDLFCESLQPFQDTLRSECAEAYENGETVGFDDGEAEGYAYGYEAAKKEFSHPINTPNSLKGN